MTRKRIHVRLSFDVEYDSADDDHTHIFPMPRWLGSDLISEGLNGLIDAKVATAPIKLFDDLSIDVSTVSAATLERRDAREKREPAP